MIECGRPKQILSFRHGGRAEPKASIVAMAGEVNRGVVDFGVVLPADAFAPHCPQIRQGSGVGNTFVAGD